MTTTIRQPPYEWKFVGAETCNYGESHEVRECDCMWYTVPRPLTADEIERKFEVKRGTPEFECARLLSNSRPDRAILELPNIECIHCCEPFKVDLGDSDVFPDELTCPSCNRVIYAESYSLTTREGSRYAVCTITVCTHPPE